MPNHVQFTTHKQQVRINRQEFVGSMFARLGDMMCLALQQTEGNGKGRRKKMNNGSDVISRRKFLSLATTAVGMILAGTPTERVEPQLTTQREGEAEMKKAFLAIQTHAH